jgi:PAS domain S-box-containing protein
MMADDNQFGAPETAVAVGSPARPGGGLQRLAWLPIPLLLALIAGLWVADPRTVYESRAAMVLLNLFFTWLASLCICILTARGFLGSGKPGLLMFGCGALLWGVTSLAAAMVVDDVNVNPTITVHNLGALGAALCHLVGLLWGGRLARPGRWLVAGYAGALLTAAVIFWAALTGATPPFFVQGQGGTPIREVVLLLAIASFAWVAWRMIHKFRRQTGAFYYWYGLGLALFATGLTGVALLSVQGGILGWVNRLTQYLGSAYLFIAAWMAAREAGAWKVSLAAAEQLWRDSAIRANLRQQTPLRLACRYGSAVVAVAAALGVRQAVAAWGGSGLPPYLVFAATGLAVVLFAGIGPGILSIVLTDLAVAYWILPPVGEFAIASPVDRLGMMLYTGVWLFFCVIVELYRRNRDKAAAYDREMATRESREAMRASEDRYHSLFTSMTEGFAIHDLLTDEAGQPVDYRFLDVNPAFERLTGLNRQDVVGKTHNEVLPGDDPKWLQMYSQVALTGQPAQFENYAPGLGRHYEVFAYRPAPRQFAVIFVDITARKRAEDELRRAAEDLKRSNADLEQFAYVASHDLQEPLRMVTGFLTLLNTKCKPQLDAQAGEFIGFAVDGAGRMSQLITDLLAYSRVERKGRTPEPTNANTALTGALANLRGAIREAGATVTHDELPTVRADATQLMQLFQNLVGNAVKFRSPDRPCQVHVGSERQDGQWAFSIRDNGIGIPPDAFDRVFMIFQRLHTREEYPGTGIGLAICKRIVERHGGRIWVASEPDKGTTFHFTLSA